MGSVLRAWVWGVGCQVYLNPRWTQRQVRQERPAPPSCLEIWVDARSYPCGGSRASSRESAQPMCQGSLHL